MSKYTPITTETNSSVAKFIKTIPDEQKQQDSFTIIEMMKKISGFEPKMWGTAIIGFGTYHYKYDSGHEGDAPLLGFSPRKAALSLYLCSEFDQREELLKKFGKHTSSKACIYVKKLDDVDLNVLEKMIKNSLKYTKGNSNHKC
jgi:hypothetical protein